MVVVVFTSVEEEMVVVTSTLLAFISNLFVLPTLL